MKKYMPIFYETLFANLFFWVIVYGIIYFFRKDKLIMAIIFIVSISVVYAVSNTLKAYYTKKRNKVGVFINQGVMGLINLTLCSASLIMVVRYVNEKKYILLGLFLILAFIFYYKFDQLFQKDKENNS